MVFRVGTSVIDCDRREVRRNGVDAHVPRKTFDLLQVLLNERPKVVGKDELISRVWPDTFVSDANLTVLIGDLRLAFGDSAKKPKIIKTHHGVGYSFIGVATEIRDLSASLPIAVLVMGTRRVALHEGSISVGRAKTCDVVLSHRSVSHVHARLIMAGNSVVVEDTGSKNGTFVDDESVKRATLQHGQRIMFGNIVTSIVMEGATKTTTLTMNDGRQSGIHRRSKLENT